MMSSFLLKINILPVLSLLCFFRLYFLSTARISYFPRFTAEAGLKGEMSHFLDAPDA